MRTKYHVISASQVCTCKVCGNEKPYRFSHIVGSGNYVYVDNLGRLWKSRVCPKCQADKRRLGRNPNKSALEVQRAVIYKTP